MSEAFAGDGADNWDEAFRQIIEGAGLDGEQPLDTAELPGQDQLADLGASALGASVLEEALATPAEETQLARLERLNTALEIAVDEIDELGKRQFATYDEISEVITPLVTTAIQKLMAVNDNEPIELEASRQGVVYTDAKAMYDPDNPTAGEGEMVIKLRNVDVVVGNPFAVRRGYFAGKATVTPAMYQGDSGEEFYVAVIALELGNSKVGHPLTITSEDIGMTLYEMPQKYTVGVIAKKDVATIELPQYHQVKNFTSAIGRFAEKFPDADQLPAQLHELQQLLLAADINNYTELDDLTLLHSIAKAVEGNPDLAEQTAQLLDGILKHQEIRLDGDIYDKDGELTESIRIADTVRAVVSGGANIPDGQLYIVYNHDDDGEYNGYVPLRSVQRFLY